MSTATLLKLAKKAFFLNPTTLSLGCYSWHKHEVRLSMSGFDEDFLQGGGGGVGGEPYFEEILDIFGQQNRQIQL